MFEGQTLYEMARADFNLLSLFLIILQNRLIIIDDLEFQNLKQNPSTSPFLNL